MTLLLLGAVLLILTCIYFVVVRNRREHWPVTDASIQRGAIGVVLPGRNSFPAAFMGYAFEVKGVRYANYFVVFGSSESRVHNVHRQLPGALLSVRYDPSDPNTSFLVNYNDGRFGGLTASQDAIFLASAPAFDLQDTLGK